MAEKEESEVTSSHRYTKITTIYGAFVDEKDQKTNGKDLLH